MTDPLLPSTAERLAALHRPAEKRQAPAHTSKILTAGISTTALLGLVAAMGWQAGTGTAQATAPAAPVVQTTTPAALVVPGAPATTAVAPVMVTPTVAQQPAASPVTPAPVAPVAAGVPVVIPVAVPVAQPAVQNNTAPAASNTTTKTSG